MAFHDVRFPTAISFGSSGGPERRTEIVSLASGAERRNSPWAHARRRWDAGYGLRSLADIASVVAFFEARRGRPHGFRWRDPLDWTSGAPGTAPTPLDQALGLGDGASTDFQLTKRYAAGPSPYDRPISTPDAASVRVALDGAETSAFSVEPGGVVRFSIAPSAGVSVSAGFQFDTPARFDVDYLTVNAAAFEAGEIPSIPILEIKV